MSPAFIQKLFQGFCQFRLIGRQIQSFMDSFRLSSSAETFLRSAQLGYIQ
jgi:hypothetical protein